MKKNYFINVFFLCSYLLANGQNDYTYSPVESEFDTDYRWVESFVAIVNPVTGYDGWSIKIEVQNATLIGNNTQSGMSAVWFVDFTTANTQVTVKIGFYQNNILINSKTWKINVAPPQAVSISGPNQIEENTTATYTAIISNSSHPVTASYNWTSNEKLSILSGQGTANITARAGIGAGIGQLNVIVGGISASKSMNITLHLSDTTNIFNQTITSNVNYSNRFINVSNTTIANNATVNITAEESITISPPFLAQQGTTVTIKVTESSILRSSNNIDNTDIVMDMAKIPVRKGSAILSQNVPNPFSDRTMISYVIPEEAKDSYINIYDLQGKIVKHVDINKLGTGKIYIESTDLVSGMYIYSLFINDIRENTKRMIVN
jgi:hypothetical protein